MSSFVSRSRAGVRGLRQHGSRAVADRLLDVAQARIDSWRVGEPLPPRVADSSALDLKPGPRLERGHPLRLVIVMSAPSPGSGGHTTLFRLVEALERAGHTCTLALQTRFGGDPTRHVDGIKKGWPAVVAEGVDGNGEWPDADVVVATSWQSAHDVAVRATYPIHRFYVVQDYEPWFYARGSAYALAEDTYRFGFDTITVGPMLAQLLKAQHGVEATVAPFGCDGDVYSLQNLGSRRGVAAYIRPGTPRRGSALALEALRLFADAAPDHPVHLFGDTRFNPGFAAVRHGHLYPRQLAALYNECVAGLALSFTNASLVPDEMLACGSIPVVNASPVSGDVFENGNIVKCLPTPGRIAEALLSLVHTVADQPERSHVAAASARKGGWLPAQEAVVRAVESAAYGPMGERGRG